MSAPRPAPIAFLLLCAAALVLGAQQQGAGNKTATKPEIRGVVYEGGLNQVLADAEVSYWKVPANGAIAGGTFTTENALGATKTDADGAFRFMPGQVGRYYVRSSKEAYGPVSGMSLTTGLNVSLTSEQPVREIRLMLVRPGEIRGRLVDEETGETVTNLRLFLCRDYTTNGKRLLIPSHAVVTDAEGRFSAKVAPGDFLVQVLPRASATQADRLLMKFSDDDLKVVETDYEGTFWPGGRDAESAYPVAISSGDTVDLGVLKIRKVRLYRVRFLVSAAACTPSESLFIYTSNDLRNGMSELGQTPCGKDLLVRGFAPGFHQMEFVVAGPPDARKRGSISVHVVDRNLDIPVSLGNGVDIAGKIAASEGAGKPPLDRMRVVISPVVSTAWSDEIPVAADTAGSFQVANLQLADQRLLIQDLPASYYVKEVRYNGHPVRGSIVALDAGAASHTLVIEVDDKPAFVTGVVTERDRAVNQPYVVLTPWPVRDPASIWPIPSTTGDADGKFQFTGLAPGEYRILAVSSAVKYEFNKPDVLARLLANAKRVELGPRGNQNLTLELTELR
jgi:hypothetical protein